MSSTIGRPTKLTPKTQADVVAAIKLGTPYEHAAAYAGIHYDTFNNWMKRGRAEVERRDNPRVKADTEQWEREQPFVDFFEAVKAAEGRAAVGWLAKIEKAADEGAWQAAAWKAERRYPQHFARRNYARIEGMDELIRVAEEKGIPVGDVIAALVDTLNEVDDASDG